MPPGWVTLPDAAAALGIPPGSLYRAIKGGEVTAYREFLWRGRIYYGFKKKDLEGG